MDLTGMAMLESWISSNANANIRMFTLLYELLREERRIKVEEQQIKINLLSDLQKSLTQSPSKKKANRRNNR